MKDVSIAVSDKAVVVGDDDVDVVDDVVLGKGAKPRVDATRQVSTATTRVIRIHMLKPRLMLPPYLDCTLFS